MALLLLLACAPEGMVYVPPGPFYMGSPHPGSGGRPQRPPAEVWLWGYYIDRYEVTQADYARFVEATGYRAPYVDEDWASELGFNWEGGRPPPDKLDHPVVLVSFHDAAEYCRWAGKRLPTEAEWEKASYGTDGRWWPWGDAWVEGRANQGRLARVDNFDDRDGYKLTSPVGAFPEGASPYGVLDIFGNAWEWTDDPPSGDWAAIRGRRLFGMIWDPRGPEDGIYRAVRGGSYFFPLDREPYMERQRFLTEARRKSSGFRCAAD